MKERHWAVVVGASRELLQLIKVNKGTVPEYSRHQAIEVGIHYSALAHRAGQLAWAVEHEFRKDVNRDDSVRIPRSRVAGSLSVSFVQNPAAKIAALRLWKFYVEHVFDAFDLDREPKAVASTVSGETIVTLDWAEPIPLDEKQNCVAKLMSMPDAALEEFEKAVEQLSAAFPEDSNEIAVPKSDESSSALSRQSAKKKAGRTATYNADEDSKLVKDWEAAKSNQVRRVEFADSKRITLKQLKNTIARVGVRLRRAK